MTVTAEGVQPLAKWDTDYYLYVQQGTHSSYHLHTSSCALHLWPLANGNTILRFLIIVNNWLYNFFIFKTVYHLNKKYGTYIRNLEDTHWA